METRKGRSLFESPALKSEDLEALQQALKELEAKEVAGKAAAGANATQSISEQTTPPSGSETEKVPDPSDSEVPSNAAVAVESSKEVEASK